MYTKEPISMILQTEIASSDSAAVQRWTWQERSFYVSIIVKTFSSTMILLAAIYMLPMKFHISSQFPRPREQGVKLEGALLSPTMKRTRRKFFSHQSFLRK